MTARHRTIAIATHTCVTFAANTTKLVAFSAKHTTTSINASQTVCAHYFGWYHNLHKDNSCDSLCKKFDHTHRMIREHGMTYSCISMDIALSALSSHNLRRKTESTTNSYACSLDSWAAYNTSFHRHRNEKWSFYSCLVQAVALCLWRAVCSRNKERHGVSPLSILVDCGKKSTTTGSSGPLASSRLYNAGQTVAWCEESIRKELGSRRHENSRVSKRSQRHHILRWSRLGILSSSDVCKKPR
jgi:hypothetical protein